MLIVDKLQLGTWKGWCRLVVQGWIELSVADNWFHSQDVTCNKGRFRGGSRGHSEAAQAVNTVIQTVQ